MNIKTFFTSNSSSRVVTVLIIILAVLMIFQGGFMVGYRKGVFTSNLDRRYMNGNMMRGPGDNRPFFAPFMHGDDDVNPHGAIGEIVSINYPSILIKGPGRAEEIIVISDKTTIRNFRQIASTSDLVVGKPVIVIGEPNKDGEIIASLIRIMPPPQDLMSTSTNF